MTTAVICRETLEQRSSTTRAELQASAMERGNALDHPSNTSNYHYKTSNNPAADNHPPAPGALRHLHSVLQDDQVVTSQRKRHPSKHTRYKSADLSSIKFEDIAPDLSCQIRTDFAAQQQRTRSQTVSSGDTDSHTAGAAEETLALSASQGVAQGSGDYFKQIPVSQRATCNAPSLAAVTNNAPSAASACYSSSNLSSTTNAQHNQNEQFLYPSDELSSFDANSEKSASVAHHLGAGVPTSPPPPSSFRAAHVSHEISRQQSACAAASSNPATASIATVYGSQAATATYFDYQPVSYNEAAALSASVNDGDSAVTSKSQPSVSSPPPAAAACRTPDRTSTDAICVPGAGGDGSSRGYDFGSYVAEAYDEHRQFVAEKRAYMDVKYGRRGSQYRDDAAATAAASTWDESYNFANLGESIHAVDMFVDVFFTVPRVYVTANSCSG